MSEQDESKPGGAADDRAPEGFEDTVVEILSLGDEEDEAADRDNPPLDVVAVKRLEMEVAADGSFAAVGASARTVIYQDAGAFYLLQRVAGAWSVIGTYEEPATTSPGRALGAALALGDDLLAVGAPGYGNVGIVYVYAYAPGTGWVLQVSVASPVQTPFARFGAAVGVSQGQVLVGETPGSLPADDMVIGTAHVYDAAKNWAATQTLTATDSAMGDRFGFAIAAEGDTAVIAAPGKESARGAVYVFTRSAGVWTAAQKLVIAGDRAEGDFFGHSLALAGDRVLVGAYGRYGQLGAAYLFVRSGETWAQTQELTAEVPMAAEVFPLVKTGEIGRAHV